MILAPYVPLAGVLTPLDDGFRGVMQTIGAMRQLVTHFRVAPDIRRVATQIIFLTPERNGHARANAIFEWVRDHIRYVPDVLDVETLSTPDKTLQGMVGDCDDSATLLATLLESVGFPTRFVVTGYHDADTFEHVYLQVLSDGEWVDADPTEHEPFGWAAPNPTAYFVEG